MPSLDYKNQDREHVPHQLGVRRDFLWKGGEEWGSRSRDGRRQWRRLSTSRISQRCHTLYSFSLVFVSRARALLERGALA